ncbi:MAG: tetratricopeptide repeat protein [Phycisphaerae bacterium]|nr:tetratricopeptide repeat protein [Phycisphaerae bacterium]
MKSVSKTLLLLLLILPLASSGCHKKGSNPVQRQWNQTRVNLALSLAENQYEAKQYEKALAAVDRILQQAPNSAAAYHLMGQICFAQNNNSDAIQCFEKAISINPDNAISYYWLGITFESIAQRKLALESYQSALKIAPDNISYCLAAVELLVTDNEHSKAFDLITAQLQNGINEQALYVAAGNILRDIGKNRDAAIMYRKALVNGPDNITIQESLAMALVNDGQYDQGIGVLERIRDRFIMEQNPIPVPVKLALGDCYFQQGRFHEARRCFEYVSARDTSSAAIWTRLARTALAVKSYNKAEMYARKAIALDKDYVDAIIIVAHVAMKNSQYIQAEQSLKHVLSIDEKNVFAYCLLGSSYEHQQKIPEALNCYARALQIDPDTALAQELMTACQSKIKSY